MDVDVTLAGDDPIIAAPAIDSLGGAAGTVEQIVAAIQAEIDIAEDLTVIDDDCVLGVLDGYVSKNGSIILEVEDSRVYLDRVRAGLE
jgi:hypothetical protein